MPTATSRAPNTPDAMRVPSEARACGRGKRSSVHADIPSSLVRGAELPPFAELGTVGGSDAGRVCCMEDGWTIVGPQTT
jgi:hypothetical protein